MPTIKKTAPLLSEGEYCGQARRVTMEWSKPKVNPDGSKTEPYQLFRIPLHIPGCQVITTIARVLDSTGWVFANICKSRDLVPPEGDEFVLTADDLENRKFFFGVVHTEYNGQKRAEVKFHAQTYAEQVNPALKGVTFPNEAPRGVQLRSATPSPAPVGRWKLGNCIRHGFQGNQCGNEIVSASPTKQNSLGSTFLIASQPPWRICGLPLASLV